MEFSNKLLTNLVFFNMIISTVTMVFAINSYYSLRNKTGPRGLKGPRGARGPPGRPS